MIVIARRVVEGRELVVLHPCDYIGRQTQAKFVEVVFVRRESEFIVVRQTVEANILQHTGSAAVIETVGKRILGAYTSPCGFGKVLVVAVDRNTVFIALQTVFQNVFRYFAEVQIQVAAVVVRILGVQEGTHKPELHVLDVRLLEVGVVHLAHNAAPATFRLQQVAFVIDIFGVEVIGAALVGIVRQVQCLYVVGFAIAEFAVGEYLARFHLANIRIGQLLQIALYISGGHRRISRCKQTVDIVPVEQCSVFAVVYVVVERSLGEERILAAVVGSRSKEPRIRIAQVYAGLGSLKVVDVRRAAVGARLLLVRHQPCVFGNKAQARWLGGVDSGNLVQKVGQPHKFAIVGQI